MKGLEHVKVINSGRKDITSTYSKRSESRGSFLSNQYRLPKSKSCDVPCRNSNTRSFRLGPIQCNVAPSGRSSVSTPAPLLRAHIAYISAVVIPDPILKSKAFFTLPRRYRSDAMRAARRQERPLFSRKTPTATAKAVTLCEAHEA